MVQYQVLLTIYIKHSFLTVSFCLAHWLCKAPGGVGLSLTHLVSLGTEHGEVKNKLVVALVFLYGERSLW